MSSENRNAEIKKARSMAVRRTGPALPGKDTECEEYTNAHHRSATGNHSGGA